MKLDDVTISQLAHAVREDDLEQVRAILQVRPELVNMDTRDNEHRVLHYAVYNRSPEMVRLLMQYEADAHMGIWPIRDPTTAFAFAVERGYDEIADIIRQEDRRREQANPGTVIHGTGSHREDAWPAALSEAARSLNELAFLAALEANPSAINTFFYSMAPLHAAGLYGWEPAVTWLLEHGANVNRREGMGPSPLEVALFRQEPSSRTVSLLKDAGAEITSRAAIGLGDADAVRRMYGEGKLQGRLPSPHGDRPCVEVAAAYKRPEMIALLFDLGLQLTPHAAVLLGKGDWLLEHHAAGTLENPIDLNESVGYLGDAELARQMFANEAA